IRKDRIASLVAEKGWFLHRLKLTTKDGQVHQFRCGLFPCPALQGNGPLKCNSEFCKEMQPTLRHSAYGWIITPWRNAPAETSLVATTRTFLRPPQGRRASIRLVRQRQRTRPLSNSAAWADSRAVRRAPANSQSSNAPTSPARRRSRAG